MPVDPTRARPMVVPPLPADTLSGAAGAGEPSVRLDGVSKRYAGEVVALQPTTLDVQDGEFLSLLGPSGSGKSTLLRLIGGFETPTTGRVILAGRDVTRVPAAKRDVNTVFQTTRSSRI